MTERTRTVERMHCRNCGEPGEERPKAVGGDACSYYEPVLHACSKCGDHATASRVSSEGITFYLCADCLWEESN